MTEQVERITELYAGVFAVPLGGVVAENIMVGLRYGVPQATVEHHAGAVPGMIRLCDEIERAEGLPWRLVRFDADGIHELDPDDFREYEDFCQRAETQPDEGDW